MEDHLNEFEEKPFDSKWLNIRIALYLLYCAFAIALKYYKPLSKTKPILFKATSSQSNSRAL